MVLGACSDDASSKTAKPSNVDAAECDEDELDQDCTCGDDDELTGTTVCSDDGKIECKCDDDPAPAANKDASKPPNGKDASASKDTGTTKPTDEKDASASEDDEDASMMSMPDEPTTSGDGPKIPEITGDCPEFKSGTATIAGLSGITLEVGAKKSGGPLLFYWHGTYQQASEYKRTLPPAVVKDILDSGGIIVSPQGTTNKGADCSGTAIFKQGDFEVMDLIAACAVKNQGIDPRRIYTTGCSAGGLQAGCMGMMRSSYIAAAAPNSGGEVFNQKQQDGHTPALMTMHGGPNDMVLVTFSETSATADKQYKAGGAS